MLSLAALYHWSPAVNHASIREHGLRPHSPNTVASGVLPYVALGACPRSAWRLSAAIDWCAEIDYWDLWLAQVAQTDELHVRPTFGPRLDEVIIRGPVPADRLWWVGRRDRGGVPGELLPER